MAPSCGSGKQGAASFATLEPKIHQSFGKKRALFIDGVSMPDCAYVFPLGINSATSGVMVVGVKPGRERKMTTLEWPAFVVDLPPTQRDIKTYQSTRCDSDRSGFLSFAKAESV